MSSNGTFSIDSEQENSSCSSSSGSASQNLSAPAPTHKYDHFYKMNHPKRGEAYIFNIKKIKYNSANIEKRIRAEEDGPKLKSTLEEHLNFNVVCPRASKHKDIENELIKVAKMDHSESDCLVISVLSNGWKDYIYTESVPYIAQNIWFHFTADKCKTLAGKPKIFIIQASNGDLLNTEMTERRTQTDGSNSSFKISLEADILVVYSTLPDSLMFINPLCDAIRYRKHSDSFVNILNFVTQKIVRDFELNNPNFIQGISTPCIMSMLTRCLYFFPKENLVSRNVNDLLSNYSSDCYYNMNYPNRGMAIILNHTKFKTEKMPRRVGTEPDCNRLMHVLKEVLKFEVVVCLDYTLEKIQMTLKKVALKDHSKNACLMVVVMTHGEDDMLYAYDYPYKIETIWSYFTPSECSSLVGKPKSFFIQACRGNKYDKGINLRKTETDGSSISNFELPHWADFLISYSTTPGHVAWRNEEGSRYVQVLCDRIEDHRAKYDLLTILTLVSREVAFCFESYPSKNKQTPCYMSMLTRFLKFDSE